MGRRKWRSLGKWRLHLREAAAARNRPADPLSVEKPRPGRSGGQLGEDARSRPFRRDRDDPFRGGRRARGHHRGRGRARRRRRAGVLAFATGEGAADGQSWRHGDGSGAAGTRTPRDRRSSLRRPALATRPRSKDKHASEARKHGSSLGNASSVLLCVRGLSVPSLNLGTARPAAARQPRAGQLRCYPVRSMHERTAAAHGPIRRTRPYLSIMTARSALRFVAIGTAMTIAAAWVIWREPDYDRVPVSSLGDLERELESAKGLVNDASG